MYEPHQHRLIHVNITINGNAQNQAETALTNGSTGNQSEAPGMKYMPTAHSKTTTMMGTRIETTQLTPQHKMSQKKLIIFYLLNSSILQ